MANFNFPIYDECRRWIQRKHENGASWESLRLACKDSIPALSSFLKLRVEEDNWPILSIDEWVELVDECFEYEQRQQDIVFQGNDGAIVDKNQNNGLNIPENPRSCWQMYKNSLKWKESSIKELELSSIGILRQLAPDTRANGPVKGLVIGHVQSGKTANMEALMAMSADHGWNLFIVLSGTIENLRLQTLKRMQNDLNHEGNLHWRGFEHPSKKSQFGERARDFHFNIDSSVRYFTVCLKNSARLKKLIDWIHADKTAHDKMKILIIDDESDQAGISNTATPHEYSQLKKERKGINKLIVDLVEDRHYKEGLSNGKAISINYVMYSATPYSNFLNECIGEALYPKNFIWTLKPSNEYIGPEQIYGSLELNDLDGLDMVRQVNEDDLSKVADLYNFKSEEIPDSLKKAVAWFICSVAVMRYWNYKKPISMLIHTSQKQNHHEIVSNALAKWINKAMKSELNELCRDVYNEEIIRLSKEKWIEQMPNYGIDDDGNRTEIRNYPDFEKILPNIKLLLSQKMKHIKMSEEGDFKYHSGLHLVVDNCSKNGIQKDNDYVRLAYPDSDLKPYPSPAPAFIIIGGSTLSRGLTIEGLVSTFFLRASCQADTLMQMGRWFGYRKGYELLPRIWMTNDTTNKFRFLSQLEIELRDDLRRYMVTDITPLEWGPRIKATPKVSWLRITSRGHMRNAVTAEMDFSGAKPQTVIFDDNKDIQLHNLKCVNDFIASIPGKPSISAEGNAIFWRDVKLSLIMDKLLIKKFSFSKKAKSFNEIEAFCDWIKQVGKSEFLDNWSVIVAGKGKVISYVNDDDNCWNVVGYNIGKINRSKRLSTSTDEVIDIGVLRALSDCVADVEKQYIDNFKTITKRSIQTTDDIYRIRKNANMEQIPVLIIYLIDRNSKASSVYKDRGSLNCDFDIVGLHINIPGTKINNSYSKKLTIYLPTRDLEEEVEDLK